MRTLLTSTFILLLSLQATAQNSVVLHTEKDGQDEEILLPENMTLGIDTLLQDWHAKNYLAPMNDCEPGSVNPVYPDSVYIDRLSRIPGVIEMPYNDIVRQCIDMYSGRLRKAVALMLGSSNFYIPLFEEALDAYNLPHELKYLPVIESALKPEATSRAGASGLWQFMLKTGKLYGLEVNTLVDERRDPIKSTYAAARYLRDLYDIFKDWNLVIAAYNCGPGNINKAIHRAGGSTDYWEIYPYLPRETRGYVPAFIAANYIMTYYCDHNICPMDATLPAHTDTLHISRDLHFKQIAEMCNIPMEEIRALNPQYKRDIVPGHSMAGSILRLPEAGINAVIDAGDSIYNYRADELFSKRRQVAVKEQTYSRKSSASRKATTESAPSKDAQYYKVKRGDTLSTIASKYGVTVKQLQRLNGMSNTRITAGKSIRIK